MWQQKKGFKMGSCLPKGLFTLPCWVAYTWFWVLKYLWTILPSQPGPTKMKLTLNLHVWNDLFNTSLFAINFRTCMTVMTLNNFNTFTSDWVSFSSLFLWCLLRSSFSSLSSYSLQQWNFSDSKVSVVADVAKLWIKRSHAKPSLDENMRQKSLDYITRRQRESLAMVIIKKSFGSFCNPKLNQFVADRLHSVIIIESWHQ